MIETSEMTTSEIAARYQAVWSEPDPGARRAAVEAVWAADGVQFVEGIQFRGHDELTERVAETYQFIVEGGFAVTYGEDEARHGDIITFTVRLTDAAGEVAWSARVFLLLGEGGLVREDYHLTVQPLAA